MPRILGAQPDARPVIEPEPTALRLLLRHFEPLPPPDALDPLAVHMPAGIAQQGSHPAIAVTAILPGESDDVFGENCFVVRPAGRLALCRSMLPEHAAHSPLRDSHHPSDVIDTEPSARGAQ